MTMPGPNPIEARRALDAAIQAGAPVNVLAMLQGNQIAKLLTIMLDSSPLPFKYEYRNHQLAEGMDRDGWTLTVTWQRPTQADIEQAASMGVGDTTT